MLSQTPFSFSVKLLMVGVVIVAVVQEFKTANLHIFHIDSVIFKTALGLFIGFTFSLFLVLLVTLLVPGRKSKAEIREPQHQPQHQLHGEDCCYCRRDEPASAGTGVSVSAGP